MLELAGAGPEEVFLDLGCGCGATNLAVDHLELLEPGTLPRTSSGKLRRQEALRLYRRGALAPPEKVTPLRLAAAMGRSAWAFARHRSRGR